MRTLSEVGSRKTVASETLARCADESGLVIDPIVYAGRTSRGSP
jgi:hypothetical protein